MLTAGKDTDAFVAKLDGRSGVAIWGWQGSSTGNDYANAVAIDHHGDVYACGSATPGFFETNGRVSGEGRGEDAGPGEGLNDDTPMPVKRSDMFVAKVKALLVFFRERRFQPPTLTSSFFFFFT